MRGTSALTPAKNKLRQIYPCKGSWAVVTGNVTTTTTKKERKDGSWEGEPVSKEKADPIVAFGRPPPLPPVLGPLIALSFVETLSSRDGNDD